MKYTYVVTRDTSGAQKGIVHNANLGVYTSKRRAEDHFRLVVKSRKTIGCSIMWEIGDVGHINEAGKRDIRTAYIKHNDGLVEYLKIERWLF